MTIIELQDWIKINIFVNENLISGKCNEDWFKQTNNLQYWEAIFLYTSYLDNYNPYFKQRLWHLINNKHEIVKCTAPKCNNPCVYRSFSNGYSYACSNKCANKSPIKKQKIEQTNIQRYGVPYPQMSKEIREKGVKTNLEKYGVKNISQLEEIKEKKRQTCLKNTGFDSPYKNRKLMEKSLMEKYGVKNVAFLPEILQKRFVTKATKFLKSLINNPRFKGLVEPAFTLEEYEGTGWDKIYNFRCLMCNNVFQYPLRWDRVPRCPCCFNNTHVSRFEKEVVMFIKKITNDSLEIIENDRKILDGKELDIYIPSLNLAIECDGLFYHSEKNGRKEINYHLDKTNNCEKQGIKLIHIFENEWRVDEDITKLILNNIILNPNYESKLYEVKDVSIEDLNMFLFSYSLIKEENCDIILGSYDNNELVGVITINQYDDYFKINKFITNHKINEMTTFNQLINEFNKKYNNDKNLPIYIDVDRRWSILFDKVLNNNWKLCKIIEPKIFYFLESGDHNDFELLTENIFEISDDIDKSKYDKIWDCGYNRYELKLT